MEIIPQARLHRVIWFSFCRPPVFKAQDRDQKSLLFDGASWTVLSNYEQPIRGPFRNVMSPFPTTDLKDTSTSILINCHESQLLLVVLAGFDISIIGTRGFASQILWQGIYY